MPFRRVGGLYRLMKVWMQVLKRQLEDWDGKHVEYLKSVYLDHSASESFFDQLIDWSNADPDLQTACTWLIKHHYNEKESLTASQVRSLLQIGDQMKHWEAQLHVLQLIPMMDIDAAMAETTEPFVRQSLSAENKFVKAAAYEAYFEIVKQVPELKTEFRLLCEEAYEKESASVRVKLRRILQKVPK
jgi:hypothetical protein